MITVNGTPVEFRQGMTLADALAESGVDAEAYMLVAVNGKLADVADYGRIYLPDKSEIRIMPIMSGG